MDIRIRSRMVDRVAVVEVAGELDIYTSPQLEAAIRDQLRRGHIRLLVDLSDTTHLDNTALRIFTKSARETRQSGGNLAVIYGRPLVQKIFEITRLYELIPIYPSEGAALEAVRTW